MPRSRGSRSRSPKPPNGGVVREASGPPAEAVAPTTPGADWLARHRAAVGAFVFLGAMLLFVLPRTFDYGGDTKANLDLAYWTAEGHFPNLADHPNYHGQDRVGYWAFRSEAGFVGPFFPPGLSLIGAAGFAAAKMLGVPISPANAPLVGKYIMSVLMAASVWCAWFVMRRRASDHAALAGALCLAAGSPLLSHFSQGFWVQGGALFCQAVALALLTWAEFDGRPRRIACAAALIGAGFFGVYAVVCRPTFLPFAALLVLYGAVVFRWRGWPLLVGAALAAALGLWLNNATQLHPLGIYAADHAKEQRLRDVSLMLRILLALLFSPGRGLFVYMPWTVLAVAGIGWLVWKRRLRDPWLAMHALFLLAILSAVSMHKVWFGGWSHGPRLQSDAVLSLLFLAAPAMTWLVRRAWGLALIAVLLAPAAVVQQKALQVMGYSWERNLRGFLQRTWEWRTGDWMWYMTSGRIHRESTGETREPAMERWYLTPQPPDGEKFIGHGMYVPAGAVAFQPLAREHSLVFMPPADLPEGDLYLVLDLMEGAVNPQRYRARVELNGRRLATFEHFQRRDDLAKAFRISSDELRHQPYDRLLLYYLDRPLDVNGELYLQIRRVSIVPATPENERRLEPLRADRPE